MKSFLFLIIISLSQIIFAGEFGDIDLAVRDEIIRQYSQGWDDDQFPVTTSDIWGLNLVENKTNDNCFLVVSGYAKKTSYDGTQTYQFWVCINKDSDGEYLASFLEDTPVADE